MSLTLPNLEPIASELDVDGRGCAVYRRRYNVAPTQPLARDWHDLFF